MSDSLYRGLILEHYKHPHNKGRLADADQTVRGKHASCGDDLEFTVKIDDGVITDIKFEGDGCALTIATASRLTDELKGESLERVKKISEEELFGLVGLTKDDVSPMRVKCVLLPYEATEQLVDDTK